jgi:peptidoglycan/xylan/chitin deacetylase (PgdA/CDA1 family)
MTKVIFMLFLSWVVITAIEALSTPGSKILYKDQVAVLLYHHIDDEDESSSTITSSHFKKQINYLKEKGYQFITLEQYKQFLKGSSVPNNAVLITFDDGYQSFYNIAYPFLKTLRIPAIHFIITKDLENPMGSSIPSMSIDEMQIMTRETNFIDIQCHTDSNHLKQNDDAYLTKRLFIEGRQESEEDYRNRVLQDTRTCTTKISQIYNKKIDSFAYPFGIYNKASSELLKQAGINFAFTIQPGMTTRKSNLAMLPRINAGSPWITPYMLDKRIRWQIVATRS